MRSISGSVNLFMTTPTSSWHTRRPMLSISGAHSRLFTARTMVSALHQWRLQFLPGTCDRSCSHSVYLSASSQCMRLMLLSIDGTFDISRLVQYILHLVTALLKFKGVYDRFYIWSPAIPTSPQCLRWFYNCSVALLTSSRRVIMDSAFGWWVAHSDFCAAQRRLYTHGVKQSIQ